MKNCSFYKNIDLFLALLIISALFLGRIEIISYLSFSFLFFSSMTSLIINLKAYFTCEENIEKKETVSLKLYSFEEKRIRNLALKSFKTLNCR